MSGSRHIIATGHPLASAAGLELLEQGGSVVDAAIGAAAVLTVTLPQACTIGGDCFMLIHRRGEGTIGLNASGPCPMGLSADSFPNGIPQRGPQSATVPSLVRGWHDAHQRFGRLEWRSLFRRAIQHASEGFPLSKNVARSIQQYRALLETDPGCVQSFLRNGGLQAGEPFRQEALGRTLARIAEEGPRGFFDGWVPRMLSRYVRERGGALESSDFEAIASEWVAALSADYGGLTVQVMPPNSYGLLLLVQLKLIQRAELDWKRVADAERLGALMRAALQAFIAGRDLIADPKAHAPSARPDIDAIVTRAAQVPVSGDTPNPGGTSIISVADRGGNGIVLVQSVFRAWGAAVLDRETGILLNNRLSGFTSDRRHTNAIAAGKRPAHTLCPAMLTEGTSLRYLAGSPGGVGQTITLTQVLTNVIDRGMTMDQAISAPRWSLDQFGNRIAEDAIPGDVIDALKAKGFVVKPGPTGTPYFGSAQLIKLHSDGLLSGQVDPRREDCVLAA